MIVNQLKTLDSREGIMERISPGFPLSVYQTDFSISRGCLPTDGTSAPDISSAPSLVPWHWHEDFQFCWVNRGAVRFHVVNQSCRLTQNTGLFINCRLAHMAEPDSADASYYGINVHPDLICPYPQSRLYQQVLSPLLQLSTSSVFLFDRSTPDGLRLTEAFLRILTLSEAAEITGRELLIQGELLHAWPGVLNIVHGSGKEVSASGNQRLKEILLYLEDHYAEKITLSSIADHIHLSPGECSRFFRRATGLSLFEYLIQYRIRQSKKLLRETDLDIAQIAQESGFSSQSYYTACFRKLEGCTPRQFRGSHHAGH